MTKYVKAIPMAQGEYCLYPQDYGWRYSNRKEISEEVAKIMFPLFGLPDNKTLFCLSATPKKVVWLYVHDGKYSVVNLILE